MKVCSRVRGKNNGFTRNPTNARSHPSGDCVAEDNAIGVMDHKFTVLAAAAAAVAADCDECVEVIVLELEGTGVGEDDIRRAVETGQYPGAYGKLGECALEHVRSRVHNDGGHDARKN